ncbi:MAG: hypothetical protein HY589_03650 [Candidatus Omnitrophica bacterium]|nr:hypothetical protein [Candidatus Omnitrophota bacterium]
MVAFIAGISGPSPDERIHGPSIIRLPLMLSPIFFFIAIIGVFRRKRYGRILSLILESVSSLAMFYVSWNALFAVPKEIIKENYIFASVVAFIGLAFLGIVYFLIKPNVKEYFKQTSVTDVK